MLKFICEITKQEKFYGSNLDQLGPGYILGVRYSNCVPCGFSDFTFVPRSAKKDYSAAVPDTLNSLHVTLYILIGNIAKKLHNTADISNYRAIFLIDETLPNTGKMFYLYNNIIQLLPTSYNSVLDWGKSILGIGQENDITYYKTLYEHVPEFSLPQGNIAHSGTVTTVGTEYRIDNYFLKFLFSQDQITKCQPLSMPTKSSIEIYQQYEQALPKLVADELYSHFTTHIRCKINNKLTLAMVDETTTFVLPNHDKNYQETHYASMVSSCANFGGHCDTRLSRISELINQCKKFGDNNAVIKLSDYGPNSEIEYYQFKNDLFQINCNSLESIAGLVGVV